MEDIELGTATYELSHIFSHGGDFGFIRLNFLLEA